MTYLKKIDKTIIISNLYKIRNLILYILDKIGINEIFRSINKDKYIILWYHGVSHRFIKFSKRHVAKSEFERQVIYLKKKNYVFITLKDLISILKIKKKVNHRYVIITFDDGFKDVIKNAYPLMKKYGAKGCSYIVSDIIDGEKLLWTDYIEVLVRNSPNSEFKFVFNSEELYFTLNSELNIQKACEIIKEKLRSVSNSERLNYLKQFSIPNKISAFNKVPQEYTIVNWSDLISLDKKILEVGCHTKTHPSLETLKSDLEFFHELKESKNEIENKMGYEINHLCYPAGSFNEEVIKYVKNFKYKTATTTIEGLNSINTDLLKLKRLQMVNNFILFKAKISGLYFFIINILKRNFRLI